MFFMVLLIIEPAKFLDAGREAIRLCLDIIIPSLFPFLVSVGILVKLGLPRYMSRNLSPLMRPLFNIPGSGALALIMGLISGYPLGAKIARELYVSGDCTKAEAERMLAFCNNSGPLFIIGAVGAGMLSSPAIGQVLYISHVLSALLVGMIFRFYHKPANVKPYGNEQIALPVTAIVVKKEVAQGIVGDIGDAVYSAVQTMAKICGFVILFAAVVAAIPNFGGGVANASVAGIIEITEGVLRFAELSHLSLPLKLSIISFVLAFSGLSVMAQVAAIIKGSGLSMTPYVAGKFIAGIISAGITYAICIFFPLNIEQYAFAPRFVIANITQATTPFGLFVSSFTVVLWGLIGIVTVVVVARAWRKFRA